ncbi:MAG: bifunctional glutamate N-acetyltransferase/amino-acid acetyltransferase ArgJ [Deltaproteobacteria bacterium]|nr:bifunctional glutamate N-acetyltransferase/amino-acid acetyltransferase ArgJ [Deltaproteobacteria bacterium]MBW2121879.1 bifunctional glutamate N-acetyltransferase/amino-acid acetyltransferase ArgJ [Deltaproteobacteria bacterium]
MTEEREDLFLVPGFQFSGISGGIKKNGARDLGLIHSDTVSTAAGVFTTNRVKAAPVLLDMERIRQGRCQAILVNSGNANACTGKKGRENARLLADLVADELGISRDLVLVASTGVIGQPLPMDRVVKKLPKLVQELAPHGVKMLAEAMMTTDTRPKIDRETLAIDGGEIHICGVAKGVGMIHPRMATMLSFIVSDVSISQELLAALTREGAERTFNRVTVDGDTSTNDTLLVLANGRAGNRRIDRSSSSLSALFQEKLWAVMDRLSKKLVEDGEGATKFVEILVRGAPEEEDALKVAFSIAHSPLVKTAFFGEDMNWGRILCAAGYSGVAIDPDSLDLFLDDVLIVQNGLGCGKEAEEKATEAMRKRSFTVTLDLHLGTAGASVFTSDLSYDYVRINGSYRS